MDGDHTGGAKFIRPRCGILYRGPTLVMFPSRPLADIVSTSFDERGHG